MHRQPYPAEIGRKESKNSTTPAQQDPTFSERHPGKSVCMVASECPYTLFERWSGTATKHRGEDYEALKAALVDQLLRCVCVCVCVCVSSAEMMSKTD